MSHFFGTLEDARIASDGTERKTKATRGGSAQSGLEAILRSNEGSVKVELYEGDDGTGGLEDRVRITFQRVRIFYPFDGLRNTHEVGQDFTLYEGPLSECSYSSIFLATQESEK